MSSDAASIFIAVRNRQFSELNTPIGARRWMILPTGDISHTCGSIEGAPRPTVRVGLRMVQQNADTSRGKGRRGGNVGHVYFKHSNEIWRDFPELSAGVLYATGITHEARVENQTTAFYGRAESRLAQATIAELTEIQAWRRTFSKMGLKPTQYRSASESLLRRFNKEGSLPKIHPLIDLCNSVSLAFAVPIAVFDVARIAGYLEVRYATGNEIYVKFSGETENPAHGEVIFADDSGRAHARRWTNRQSGYSAVRDDTAVALIVAEAMHELAGTDIHELISTLEEALAAGWSALPKSAILSASSPRFDFDGMT